MKWSKPAKDNLRKIHDFIADESPVYAKKVVRDIVERTDRIAVMPRSGRIVPEFADEHIREIVINP